MAMPKAPSMPKVSMPKVSAPRAPKITAQKVAATRLKATQGPKLGAQPKVATPKQVQRIFKKKIVKVPKLAQTGLDAEGQRNARVVLRTGKKMGATKKELLAAAETGLVESGGFHNLKTMTDHDSLGWRQERVSQYGLGPATNVKGGARRFFQESVSDTGGSRGAGQTAGQLAQTIQGSAVPEAYDQRKADAVPIVKAFLHPSGKKKVVTINKRQVAHLKKQNIKIPKPARQAIKAVRETNKVSGKQTITVKANGLGVTKWASKMLGTDEGTPRQARWAEAAGVDPSVPWCGVFVNFALKRMGVQGPANPAYSGDWLNWKGGTKVNRPKPGDLVIFDWGDGGITDHIAIYAGNNMVIGGNQSDSVTKVPWDQGATVGIIRPHYKGGKVEIPLSSLGAGVGAPGAVGGTVSSTLAAGSASTTPGAAKAGGPQAILAKLKTYGAGVGERKGLATKPSSVTPTLDALMKKYGSPAV
jgi:uncharacterized protein (TIGR02594 family)